MATLIKLNNFELYVENDEQADEFVSRLEGLCSDLGFDFRFEPLFEEAEDELVPDEDEEEDDLAFEEEQKGVMKLKKQPGKLVQARIPEDIYVKVKTYFRYHGADSHIIQTAYELLADVIDLNTAPGRSPIELLRERAKMLKRDEPK